MIEIEIIATILLVFRIISALFISTVIYWQFQLFKKYVPEEIKTFRVILFFLSIVILLGNVIPIIVDYATLVTEVPRASSLSWLSITYAVSNALTSLVSSLTIWLLYKISRDSNKQ